MSRKPKKLVLPKSLMVMGQRWTVREVDRIQDDSGVMGLCDSPSRTILILKSQSDDSKIDTLWHEVFHAYDFITPLNVPAESKEYLAQYCAAAVVDLVRGNRPWW